MLHLNRFLRGSCQLGTGEPSCGLNPSPLPRGAHTGPAVALSFPRLIQPFHPAVLELIDCIAVAMVDDYLRERGS